MTLEAIVMAVKFVFEVDSFVVQSQKLIKQLAFCRPCLLLSGQYILTLLPSAHGCERVLTW